MATVDLVLERAKIVTVKEILESIYSRDYRNEEVVNINLPENEVEIELSEEMAKKAKEASMPDAADTIAREIVNIAVGHE